MGKTEKKVLLTTQESIHNDEVYPEKKTLPEETLLRHQREDEALIALCNEVRARSAQGQLVTPSYWDEVDLLSDYMNSEELEMWVFSYLEEDKAKQKEALRTKSQEASTCRTATRAVGVPRDVCLEPKENIQEDNGKEGSVSNNKAEEAFVAEGKRTQRPETNEEIASGNAEFDGLAEELGFEIPYGYELQELEGELTLVPLEEDEKEETIDCSDIEVLVGRYGYYLYSKQGMTETYAHWAFLACENDHIATFVDCVREESRKYPRPMASSSLKNEPFSMTDDEIEQAWTTIQGAGTYPDIEMTTASNGEVYYFSNEYLDLPYATSLAEWDAVERALYL